METCLLKGLQRVAISDSQSEKAFSVKVGKKEVLCTAIQAALLSPLFLKQITADKTSNCFFIDPSIENNNDEQICNNYIDSIKKIIEFYEGRSEIDFDSIDLQLLRKLQNAELLRLKLEKMFQPNDEINSFLSEMQDELNNIINNREGMPMLEIDGIYDFIASNFYRIDLNVLKKFDIDTIYSIISSKKLVLLNEESLYSFIKLVKSEKMNELKCNEETIYKINSLFGCVEFNSMSDGIFFEFIHEIQGDFIDFDVWNSVCRKIIKSGISKERYKKTPDIGEKEEKIIKRLREKYGNNLAEYGIVEFQCSSTNGSLYNKNILPQNILNDSTDGWYSLNQPNQWIFVKFNRDIKIKPESYTIRFGADSKNYSQRWVFEGSNNGNEWIMLDDQSDSRVKNNDFTSSTFLVEADDYFNYFRIRTGSNCWGNIYFLGLCQLEIGGKLISS